MESSIAAYLQGLIEADGTSAELVDGNALHIIVDDWKAQITVDWVEIVD